MEQSLVEKIRFPRTVKNFCSVLASACHWSVRIVTQIQSKPTLDFFKIHSNTVPTPPIHKSAPVFPSGFQYISYLSHAWYMHHLPVLDITTLTFKLICDK